LRNQQQLRLYTIGNPAYEERYVICNVGSLARISVDVSSNLAVLRLESANQGTFGYQLGSYVNNAFELSGCARQNKGECGNATWHLMCSSSRAATPEALPDFAGLAVGKSEV